MEVLEVSFVYLTRSLVRRCGFDADQSIRTATALGDVCQVAPVAVDDLMQMPAPVLSQSETMLVLVRIRQKSAQLAAILTIAWQLVRPPVIGRLLPGMSRTVFQLAAARSQPVRDPGWELP